MSRHDTDREFEMNSLDAFVALRDIDDDEVEGMLRAEKRARDAFIHEGKSFSIHAGSRDLEEAKKFLDEDATAEDEIEVIDVDADTVEHIKKKEEYVGQAILCCNRCKTNRFIDMDLLEASELDEEVYNIEDECPHCHDAGSGYTLLGQVGKVQKEQPEEETEAETEEAEVENDEATDDVAFDNDFETDETEPEEEVEEEPEVETVEDEEEKDGMETDTSEEELDDLELPELGDEIDSDDVEEDEEDKVKESLNEDIQLNKYAEEAWMMNRVISAMNNEEAYYSSWLYIWPDGETREDCAYDFGDADSLSDLEQTFNRIYKHYHADGLYAAEPDVLAYAHQTDSKLGLAKIENIEAVKPHVTEAFDCQVAGDIFNAITTPEKIDKVIILDVADEKEAPRTIFQGIRDDVPMNVMGSPCKSFDVADGYLTCNVDTSCRNTNRPLNKALECFSDEETDKVLVWDQATSEEVFSGTKSDACKQFGDCEFISFETPAVIRVNIINPAILSDEEINGEEAETDLDKLVKKIIDANNMSQYKADKPNTNEYWIKQSIIDGDDVDLIYEMFVRPTEHKSLIREFKQLTGYTNALEEAFEAGYNAANKGKAVVESRYNDEITDFIDWIQNYQDGVLYDSFAAEFSDENEELDIDSILSWLEDIDEDAYYDYVELNESLETKTDDQLKWTCWFENKELGTVIAANKQEAYEKMLQEWPEYNYSEYDGVAVVEPFDDLDDDLNEAVAPKGEVDFEYTDLEVTIQGPKRDVDDWDEETFIDKYTYTVDRNQVATDIWENFFTEEDADIDGGLESLEIDSVWYAFLERRLDDLIEKYYDQLLEFYREAAAEEYVEKYNQGLLEDVNLDDVKAEAEKDQKETSDDMDDESDQNDEDEKTSLTEGKVIDAIKKVATRVGADATTIIRSFTELGEIITNIGNKGDYKSTKLNDLMTHVENKAVLKALLSGNESVMNGLTKEDIEELEDDIREYQAAKEGKNDPSTSDSIEEGIFDKKLSADDHNKIEEFKDEAEMIAKKSLDDIAYDLVSLLRDSISDCRQLTWKANKDTQKADVENGFEALADKILAMYANLIKTLSKPNNFIQGASAIEDVARKILGSYADDSSAFNKLSDYPSIMTQINNVKTDKKIYAQVMKEFYTNIVNGLNTDLRDLKSLSKFDLFSESLQKESVKSFKTRKELAKAVEECKNNSTPYTIRRSTVEGYRYDLVESAEVKEKTEVNNLTESEDIADDSTVTSLVPAQAGDIEVIDDVAQEFPAEYTPEQQALLDQIRRVSVDTAEAIKRHYGIEGDPALIVADIIRDLQLISGDISVDDLGDSGIDMATKELFRSYNAFYDFVDELISEVTGEEFVTTTEDKIKQAIRALHGPEFRTENIDRMIGSRAFIAAAQSGQVPYIAASDIPLLTEALETKTFEEDLESDVCENCGKAPCECLDNLDESIDVDTDDFDRDMNSYFNEAYKDTVIYTTTEGYAKSDGVIVLEGLIQHEDVIKSVQFTLTPERKISEDVEDRVAEFDAIMSESFTVTNNLSEEVFKFKFGKK